MEVKIEKAYPLDVDVERAWQVLSDVRAVAACMPGAVITGQDDEQHYQGAVRVKVGPASAAFAGTLEVKSIDAQERRVQLLGKGSDKGGSSASMDLIARIATGVAPSTCVLMGEAHVIVNGKFAQFGSRMILPVSDMILAEFARHFNDAARVSPQTNGPGPATPTSSAAPPPMEPVAVPAEHGPASEPRHQLSAATLVWAMIKGWFSSLFARRI